MCGNSRHRAVEKLVTLTSTAAPLPQDDIDTDIIFPARFLLITDREGLDRYAFHDWRFDTTGSEIGNFPLAREPWRGATILVAGANFGCGSSREHAPWAMFDLGIRCIIAPSFGEIFFNNCLKNGMLPIVVDETDHAGLMADANAGSLLTVDVASAEVRRENGDIIPFTLDRRRRDALLNGWDEIDMISSQHGDAIDRFEIAQRQSQPWLWSHDSERNGERQ